MRRGERTSPNPTDRRKPDMKRRLVADRAGVPLVVLPRGADRHDPGLVETLIDAIPPAQTPAGRRRKRLAKLHAGKGRDFPRRGGASSRRGVTACIVGRGVKSRGRLARQRRLWSAPRPGSTAPDAFPCSTRGAPSSIGPSSPSAAASRVGITSRDRFSKALFRPPSRNGVSTVQQRVAPTPSRRRALPHAPFVVNDMGRMTGTAAYDAPPRRAASDTESAPS